MLERAGLVSMSQEAQRRPRRLEPKPLAEATAWLENYRKLWEGNFARLDAVLDEMKAAAGKGPARATNPKRSRRKSR